MNRHSILCLLLFFWVLQVHASRPSIQSSNLSFNALSCTSLTLTWTNGDGNARVIFARENSNVNYTPVDGATYYPDPSFGASSMYANDNYVVYNGSGSGTVTIENLKPGQTYFFSFFEHDNSGSNTLYLTSNPSSIAIKAYIVDLDFNLNAIDSCENNNLFQCKNTSSSTIPGLTYAFEFDQELVYLDSFTTHLISKNGFCSIRLHTLTSLKGCSNQITKTAKIFPKKIGTFIFPNTFDSVQCFNGNYFELQASIYLFPFPSSVTYNWNYGDNANNYTTFPKMRKSYTKAGLYHVSLELTTNSYSEPTACKDTLYVYLNVLHNPRVYLTINNSKQHLQNNAFIFSNADSDVISQNWDFGDGDSSADSIVSHSYKAIGSYDVTHTVVSKDSCENGTKTYTVVVMPDSFASIAPLHLLTKILFPNPASSTIHLKLGNLDQTSSILIFDMNGKMVFETAELRENMSINLEQLVPANYLLQIIHKDGSLEHAVFRIE